MNRLSLSLVLFLFAVVANGQFFDVKQNLKQHVAVLASDSLEGRGLGTQGKDKATQYIISQFKEAGIQPINNNYLQPFSTRIQLAWVPAHNIVGIIKGSDPELCNEYILIGAHYDHLGYKLNGNEKTIYPGADDNASGVASIIELGRYFAQNPQLAKRSLLVVAFDAEESGLLGSEHFVTDSLVKMENIKAMFSIDMVGMLEKHNGLDLEGMTTIKNGHEIANGMAGPNEIVLKTVNDKIVRRTDTSPFGKIGIPAVHVFTGTESPYHKPEDKSDLLDYDGMLKINAYMGDVLANLLQNEELLADEKFLATYMQSDNEASKQYNKKLAVGLRTNFGFGHHNYNDDFFKAKSVYNFEAGLYSQINLSRHWALQTEALYNYNGSEHKDGRFTRHSVTVPMNLMLGTPTKKTNDARGFLFVGPYYQHNFAGNIGDEDLDFESEYNQTEWGFSWGLMLHTNKIQVGWVFRNGITSVTQSPLPKITACSSLLSIGYKFGK